MNDTTPPRVVNSHYGLMHLVRNYRAGGPGPKATLMALAEYAGLQDGEWVCHPSQELIASVTEQSISTVRRQIRALEEAEVIYTCTVYGRGQTSGRKHNVYVFQPYAMEVTLTSMDGHTGQPGPVMEVTATTSEEPLEQPEGNSVGDADEVGRRRDGKFLTSSKIVGDNYPKAFQDCWNLYPKSRRGGKGAAYTAWRASVEREILAGRSQGEAITLLRDATKRYAAATADKDPDYIKLAQTFWGPGRHYEAIMAAPVDEGVAVPEWMHGGTL